MIALTDLAKNTTAKLEAFSSEMMEEGHDLIERLREMGFEEGSEIVVRHFGFVMRDPIAVDVDGVRVAIRRNEAKVIQVLPL